MSSSSFAPLQGANIFITGANRGLGLGIVRELVVNVSGVKKIFAGCRKPDEAKELQQLKCHSPDLLEIVQIDVASDQSINSAVAYVRSVLFGKPLNLLINNAGVLLAGGVNLEAPNRDICLQQFNTNTLGVVMTTAAFLPLLKQSAANGQFTVVANVSGSLSQMEPMRPLHTISNQNRVYGMSKIAINFYTKALSMDVPQILAVAVHPGWIRTDMGGQKAPVGIEEAASNFVRRICQLQKEDSGKYIDWSDTIGMSKI